MSKEEKEKLFKEVVELSLRDWYKGNILKRLVGITFSRFMINDWYKGIELYNETTMNELRKSKKEQEV